MEMDRDLNHKDAIVVPILKDISFIKKLENKSLLYPKLEFAFSIIRSF